MKQTTTTRITKSFSTVRGKRYRRYVVSWHDEYGDRKRKTFSSLAKARREGEKLDHDREQKESLATVVRNKIGEDAESLPASRLRDAVDAMRILEGYATLAEYAPSIIQRSCRAF